MVESKTKSRWFFLNEVGGCPKITMGFLPIPIGWYSHWISTCHICYHMRICWRTANNVVKTMPSTIPKITINRWYVYHSQSWVVYGIVLTTLPEYISGWWFQSLWKIWKSMGRIIPNILWKIKAMFETTNQMENDNHIRYISGYIRYMITISRYIKSSTIFKTLWIPHHWCRKSRWSRRSRWHRGFTSCILGMKHGAFLGGSRSHHRWLIWFNTKSQSSMTWVIWGYPLSPKRKAPHGFMEKPNLYRD